VTSQLHTWVHDLISVQSVTLSKEHSLMAPQNWSQWILVPRRGGMRGDWRKLHNEELRDLYSSPNIMRVRCVRHIARRREKRNT
jgi:hypothetical protein